MYTIILDEGLVIRDADQKVVAPCESADDADFVAYQNWVSAGNTPLVLDTRPQG